MFAVKGWSVDAASLKPQTEASRPSSTKGDRTHKSSKKRKRAQADDSNNETGSADVSGLWEKHVEGKAPSKQTKTKERKKQKLKDKTSETADSEALARPQATNESNGGGQEQKKAASKKSKKQKRGEDGQKQGNTSHVSQTILAKSQGPENDDAEKTTAPPIPPLPPSGKLTSMQSAMRQKLVSARFRHLNETLYTKPSTASLDLFDKNPEMFEDYHAGFRQQVSVWPENPIDKFIAEIRSRGKVRAPKKDKRDHKPDRKENTGKDGQTEALPRTHGICIIADLGCGDARLAETLKNSGDTTQHNLKLHSFDLHSQSPLVTKADISKIPLLDGSVDVAIFCLALMGTNWISFIEEANRILHWKGELWIAEIKSRFGRVTKSNKVVEHSVGNKRKQAALKSAKEARKRADEERDEQEELQTEVDGVPMNKQETDVSGFVDVLKRRGFVLKSHGGDGVDLSNKMFVKMEFVKALAPTKGKGVPEEDASSSKKAKPKFIPGLEDEVASEDEATTLKPCLYKIR